MTQASGSHLDFRSHGLWSITSYFLLPWEPLFMSFVALVYAAQTTKKCRAAN